MESFSSDLYASSSLKHPVYKHAVCTFLLFCSKHIVFLAGLRKNITRLYHHDGISTPAMLCRVNSLESLRSFHPARDPRNVGRETSTLASAFSWRMQRFCIRGRTRSYPIIVSSRAASQNGYRCLLREVDSYDRTSPLTPVLRNVERS